MSELILDSHSHAWERWPYDLAVPDPATRGSAEHLIYEMDRHGVTEAVIVAARIDHNPKNNEYVAEAVRRHPGRLHQFADVDSVWSVEHHTPGAAKRLGDIADRLAPKGFTHYLDRRNDGWLLSRDGQDFFRVAAERKLIASLAAGPEWQEDIRRVAATYPELTIMIHHLGLVPAQGPESRAAMDQLLPSAELPNIVVKFSGFHYLLDDGWEYPHRKARWIAEALYQAFGPTQLCWASDFPALTRYMTYRQSLEIVRTHCDFISDSDRPWILGRTLAGLLHDEGEPT
ncbi:MAG: L-fuconolactonase [Actinomycetota bacterium]|nr:L-fuconolactonase [Actinomycetota bacterium]